MPEHGRVVVHVRHVDDQHEGAADGEPAVRCLQSEVVDGGNFVVQRSIDDQGDWNNEKKKSHEEDSMIVLKQEDMMKVWLAEKNQQPNCKTQH